jgi:gliding motility-associated-like protein
MFNSSDTIFNISTGTYILEIITSDGCQNSAFINVEITPVLDSSFTYSNSLYCENGSVITPNFIANPSSTHFYSSSTDILVDSLSGVINLGITNPGVYTIFNQPNICSGIASFEIIVDNAEDPSFYLMDTICAFQNPILVLPYDSIATTGSGHFWSSNEDLHFFDSITGLVDWKTAQKDTITTIYYNTGGYCSEIDSAKVYVKQLNSFFSYENYTLCTFEVNNIFPDSIHTQTGNLLTSYFYCPDPNLVLDSVTGEIDVDLSPLGQYQVFRVVNDECLDTTRRNITITNYFDPYFTYPVTQICQFEGILAPDTVRHNGGEFTATPAGLSIDDESGEIDLNFSNFGIYTIQYITPSDCGDTAYFTIEVLEVPNSAFSYTDTLFCDMTGTLLPTFVGSVGGVFSSPTGLIVNSATGEIDFDNSHHGSHLIIYTTTGVCTAFTLYSLVVSNTASAAFSYSQPSFCGNLGSVVPNMLASTGGNFTATPGGLVINSLTGFINLNASLPNNYTIRYVSAGQCKDTAYFNLEVLPVPSSDFGYVSYAFCDAAATGLVLPSYINTPGGTFTSTPGIVLNSVTGEIDLDASANGVYPISYTTTGICPSTTVRNFTVGVTPVAAFSYASSSFCKNEPNPFPNFTSVPGGTFTSSSSSLYVQNSTGMIYLNYSFPGTYTITYTTPGLCNSSSTFTVTINAAPITTFSYPQNYYCSYNGIKTPNVMPSISGGVFNSTAGLDLNTTTGAIDFSSSTPGTYIITYTTPGICPTTSSYTMNVHPTICDCSASLPIFEAYLNGVLVDINDLNVCYGDTLEIISQLGSTWSPHPIYPGSTVPYSPQLSMDVYHCPPSVFAPADLYTANSCFAGETLPQVGHSWTIVNDTANFQPYVNSIDDTTLYLVPHTMYNSATVTVFNPALGNRCYAIDTITVNLLPTIRATYLENCLDSSVVFSFDGGLPSSNGSAYSISTILPTTATISPLLPIQNEPTRLFPIDNGQDYSLTVNDDAGCWADFAYTNFTGTPIAFAGVDSTFCDLTGTLYANIPNFGYGYWTLPNFISVSDTSFNNTTFAAAQSGIYSLIWTAESNPMCQNLDTIVLVISDLSLQTSITNTYCFAMQGAIEIEALGGIEPYSYSINNGITHQTSSSFQNLSEGPYVIWVTDSSNCYVTENNVIGLTDDCVLIFYTGITPNNDNLNDVWFIEGLPPGNNPVVIFNRWGDIVWQTENYDNWNNPWKGENMEGKELPVGVYFYNAKVGEVDFSGFIELTR